MATPDQAPRIRVIVVDDQAIVRRSISALLATEPDLEVVGQASDGEAAVRLVERLHGRRLC